MDKQANQMKGGKIVSFLQSFIDIFFGQFMSKPALLLGTVSAIGLIAMKRPSHRIVMGAVKTAVGVLILQLGAGQLVTTFRPIIFAISDRFGVQGVIIDPYAAFPAVTEAFGEKMAWVSYTMLLAFAFNLVLVLLNRWTKMRAVFLTGHIMFLQSALGCWLVYYYFGLSQWPTVIISGLLVGLYWSWGSNLNIEPSQKVTDGAGFTIAHQQHLMNWVASKIAPRLGDPKESVDDIELPGFLNMFADNVTAVAVIMLLFFGPLMLLLGQARVQEMAGGTNWLVYILLTCLGFAVNVTVILTGVRMFVAELAVSFEGISTRVLPGAVVGVDGMAIAPYSPNSVIGGFLMCAFGQIVGVVILVLIRSPILIVPGFVPVFFDAAITAVFANYFGGWRAMAKISFVVGLIHVFGSVWAASISGLTGGWQGNSDFATVWPAVMTIMKLISSVLGIGPASGG
jgi:PTS system ascorbate-specific IIC component